MILALIAPAVLLFIGVAVVLPFLNRKQALAGSAVGWLFYILIAWGPATVAVTGLWQEEIDSGRSCPAVWGSAWAIVLGFGCSAVGAAAISAGIAARRYHPAVLVVVALAASYVTWSAIVWGGLCRTN